jgi:hypothetical protein
MWYYMINLYWKEDEFLIYLRFELNVFYEYLIWCCSCFNTTKIIGKTETNNCTIQIGELIQISLVYVPYSASSDEVASCPLDLLMKKLSPIYRRYCHIIHGRYPRRAHQWSLFCHVSACNKSRLLRFWESHVFVSDHGYNERHCRPISRTFLDTKKPYVYVSQQRSSWRRISQDWIQQVQSFIRIP